MKKVYETPAGAISGRELRSGFRLRTNRGLRPGKQINDSILVSIGRAILKGQTAQRIATTHRISTKTVYRWKKRLKLGKLARRRKQMRKACQRWYAKRRKK